jgi:phosphatidylethanolamine/phosphatidyl-N-methylethanolamine N-methyltransferase
VLVQEETFAAPVLDATPGQAGDPAVLDNRHVKTSYARWAPVYDLVFELVLRPGRKAAAAAADRLGGHVLDVGVGTGLELPMFDRRTRLTGIDLSEPMLRRAQRRVRAKALGNVEGLIVMDAARLAFPDAHFDAVVAPYVLTVVPEPHATLHEMARVVKPGGEIILVNHVGSGHGPMAWIESALAKCGAELGWQPEFAWSILGDWIDSTLSVRLVERRKLPPFGLFTLARIARL